jgi:gamma-glutamyltranspeptidase/glutathione hydrolase
VSPQAKRFPRGCVASPHYLASAAGLAVLADGGNALDAAIATNLTLGVTTSYMCGYGGDLFAIVYDGSTLHGYNGSGRSSANATLEAARNAIGSDVMPQRGPHTVTVPGAVEGWFTLLERFGSRSFEELARTPLRYAREGFPLTDYGRNAVRASVPVFRDEWAAEWRSIYADVDDYLVQRGLARTIEWLCREGPDAYYRGPIAEAIATTLQGFGALITMDDLAAHHGDWVEPISTTYRDRTIFELPPNSQGIAALEALNIVEELDLGEPGSTHRHHALIEAVKLALADRDRYVTDPDHMTIATDELASKAWAASRRGEVDLARASTPVPGRAAVGGTVYLCAADEAGMLVSLIQSNYAGYGSGVTVPGWGINLQNRGAFFSLDGSHANVIAPSKRTMHTLMPAMAFRGADPWLVFGTMGGDGQAQTHLQFLDRVIDDGRDIRDAIGAPRWVVSPRDWSVMLESRFDEDLVSGLAERGHNVSMADAYDSGMGHAHAIELIDGGYACATDPRAEGAALGH